ncbi:inositol polyphosphate-5-phosphatase A-like [Stegodyphus dumicola]|uniref:inositol polyphosphate-5-phosphatase A-like n=1 Tax=Stegodyphus dumicola TaxID=202533 RepID=UPI0015B1261A|nr:inositol polyphosphate-5-phosphatase A-like [Stegodyphus dumicola]
MIYYRFSTDQYEKVPFFIFGDCNFCLDTKDAIQKLTNQAVPVYVKSAQNGEVEKMLYRDPGNENKIEFEGETTDGNFALDDVTFYDGNCQTHPVEAAVEPPPSEKFQVV